MAKKIVVERTSKGLTEVLFDELEALLNEESTPTMARAKASLAQTIVRIKELEINYASLSRVNDKLKAIDM